MPSGDYPFERTIGFMVSLSGWGTLISGYQPIAIKEALPMWEQVAWSLMLGVGGILMIVGVAWRGRFTTSVSIETTGLLLVAGGCLLFAIALAIVSWTSFLFAMAMAVAILVGCIQRVISLQRERRRITG